TTTTTTHTTTTTTPTTTTTTPTTTTTNPTTKMTTPTTTTTTPTTTTTTQTITKTTRTMPTTATTTSLTTSAKAPTSFDYSTRSISSTSSSDNQQHPKYNNNESFSIATFIGGYFVGMMTVLVITSVIFILLKCSRKTKIGVEKGELTKPLTWIIDTKLHFPQKSKTMELI
uniref:Uncharacterized protein n=1 Tax=Clytia hemisphaerica TaxID=252671 RepID=A0A7M5V080_9CNID